MAVKRHALAPSLWRAHLVDLLIVGVAALALRGLYFATLWDEAAFQSLQVNAARYDAWARMILAGQAPSPPWEQSPGYAYFLSFVYAAFGTGARAVAPIQAFLSAATCCAVYWITLRCYDRNAARIAGGLACICGPLIYFSGEVLPSTLFVALCAAAMTAQVGTRPTWSIAGALWATAYLVRANVIFALPLAAAQALMVGGGRAVAGVVVPVVVAAALLAGVSTNNEGTLVLTTTSRGVNLWLGNNPTADGVNPFFGPDQIPVSQEVRAQANTAAAADTNFSARALRYWLDRPGEAMALAAKKLLWTFTARELPNNVDIDWKRSHSWLFRIPGVPLGFGILLVLFAIGCVLRPPRSDRAVLLACSAAIAIGTCVTFFTNARFRLPIFLPLLVVGGAGIAGVLRNTAAVRDSPQRLAATGVAVLIAGAIAWGNWLGVADYRVPQIAVNVGAFERERKNFEVAIEHLRAGLEAEPRDAIGWIHLALALEESGDVTGARESYDSGLDNAPGDPQLLSMRARFDRRNPAP